MQTNEIDVEISSEQICRVRQWLRDIPESYADSEPPFECGRKKTFLTSLRSTSLIFRSISLSFRSRTDDESGFRLEKTDSDLEASIRPGCLAGMSNILKNNKLA
jgi:hypothetical protein